MYQTLKAIYQQGAFVLTEPYDLPDGSEVEITVQRAHLIPPEIDNPETRGRLLKRITERMRQNPIPPDAPALSREALHERP